CSLEEAYELKLKREQLYIALSRLPDKQAKRIYAHYFLGMSKAEIADVEGVGRRTVSESIALGLQGIEQNLRKLR
ncbi:MAG: sigma factor-like helix-turn-helix DNA-binding protein, partial [Clostridia bacterium]